MKTLRFLKRLAIAFGILISPIALNAQNSLPAPGSGGSFNPSGGYGGPGPVFPNGGWSNPGPGWGPANGIGWNPPSVIVNTAYPTYNNQNNGVINVIACGYDAQGVWRNIPMYVAYQYNGVQYDVTVLNAWNPWTDTWDKGLDAPAYNTAYYLNGTTFDFYTVLSTGTYYFNL